MGLNLEQKIILVTRPTRLEELVVRYNTREQAQFYIEHLGGEFSDYVKEHERYAASLAAVQAALQRYGRLQMLDRSFLPNFLFGESDTVVVLGQDGLVANTAKYLDGHAIVGVNPDPARWDGILLPFKVTDLDRVIPDVIANRRPWREVAMARVDLNNGQYLYAVNDLFIGMRTHGSARYVIEWGGRAEQQSSSGIIISTGLGSTGWFKSILTGAQGILREAGVPVSFEVPALPIDADYLYYSVREPFPSKATGTTLVFGQITAQHHLTVSSQMPESGLIFSDGVEKDFLAFNSGAVATIRLAEKRAKLVQ